MPSQFVPINGSVLRWAREESGLTSEVLAEKLGIELTELLSWESGASSPGRGQFSRLVDVLKRPSAIFFLSEPPTTAAVPTSFRRAPALGRHELSQDEVRQIRWTRRVQEIVSWALQDSSAARVELPRLDVRTQPAEAAQLQRTQSGVSVTTQLGWSSPSEAFNAWRGALEDAGILVMQVSLGRSGIRGFSAWDEWAPAVAVNSAYHPTARIFTLFHEVAHLLTRTDSACYSFVLPGSHDTALERWCERFAAAFLIPEDALERAAPDCADHSTGRVVDVACARRIANRFKVSTRAMSLRLQELDLAPTTLYSAVEAAYRDLDWNQQGGGGGGQTAPVKRLGQLGERVAEVLLDASADGRLNTRDLADYLRLTTGQVSDLGRLVARPA
ncbi:MAG: ImmA/IrrE family metallo-endopeptidase [Acidimicrobiia bacterium]